MHPSLGLAVPILALGLAACGGEGGDAGGGGSSQGGGGVAGGAPCPEIGSIILEDGRCLPAGLPDDMVCPPGELEVEGTCLVAGVPADGCATGFAHDGERGCTPILPNAPCPDGMMAVPGDEACREVAPCGSGAWGDIPVDATTQYVDGSYAGGDSDGTADKPWLTVQAGIDAAANDGLVAVAAGSYPEDLLIEGKTVHLWGRCPSMVEIVGQGLGFATIQVFAGASNSSVRQLSMTGPIGILTSGSQGVVFERMHVHDTTPGIQLQDDFGASSMTVRDSLIEGVETSGVGIFAASASEATVERTEVRNSPLSDFAASGFQAGDGASLTVRQSWAHGIAGVGALVIGSQAQVDGVVFSDNVETTIGQGGIGLFADSSPSGARSNVTVDGCVSARNRTAGILVTGSDAVITNSVAEDNLAGTQLGSGAGFQFNESSSTPQTAIATLRSSLARRNSVFGVFVFGATAVIEGVAASESVLDALDADARGIDVSPGSTFRPWAEIRACEIWGHPQLGIAATSADLLVDSTLIRDNTSNPHQEFGRGIQVQEYLVTGEPSVATVTRTLIRDNRDMGILAAGSSLVVLQSHVVNTQPNTGGLYGDGIGGLSIGSNPALVTVSGTRVDDSARAGLSAFGATLESHGNALVCQSFDINGDAYDGTVPHELRDLGRNGCGCPDPIDTCKAVSANLQPPNL